MAQEEKNSVHLDEVLAQFGAYGRYQIRMILLLGFAFFNNGIHSINYVFIAEEVPYRCKIEQCESANKVFNTSWYNFATPSDYRSCYKYGSTGDECSSSSFTSVVEPCLEWIYKSDDSFVAEFGLACEDWKRTFVGTVHSIGLMLGLFLQGQLSDRLGRRAAIIIFGITCAVLGVGKSFASSYLSYITLEFFEAFIGENYSPAFIMSIELVHSDFRLNQQIIYSVIFALGGVVFPITAYYIPYWRTLTQVLYAPSIVFIFYVFIMDESVRWLLSKGKKKEAIKILLKIAEKNKVSIKEEIIVNIKCEENNTRSSPLRDTLRSKLVLKRFLVCLVWWSSCTFICYGLAVNVVSLAGNKYLNFAIMAVSDVPACMVMVYTLKRFNRKKPLLISFTSVGLFCLLRSLVSKEYAFISTSLFFLGKFLSTFTFATVYIYTSELFPTYSRNSMLSLCSAIGRIGSVLAPMTPLLIQYGESIPTLVIGTVSLLAGSTTLLVPDVANEPLPDNVQQAENLGTVKIHDNMDMG
ncbi:organic cation transporter protein-like [Aricia agestis]|uniref:organic cation transporter protein-like n=1 Tax=Aricia agestis TaxID=91739 RepID=UPI001C20B13E|nr:organic cation transporter protein-like [Aricia agestis]